MLGNAIKVRLAAAGQLCILTGRSPVDLLAARCFCTWLHLAANFSRVDAHQSCVVGLDGQDGGGGAGVGLAGDGGDGAVVGGHTNVLEHIGSQVAEQVVGGVHEGGVLQGRQR